MCLNFFFFKS